MRVALLGDSHAEGIGLFLGRALAAEGHTLVHLDDRRGWSTERMLGADLIRRAAAAEPDVIVISSGHNDRGPNVEPSIREALRQLQATGKRIGWFLTGPSTRPDVEARHLANREILLSLVPRSVTVIDGRDIYDESVLAPDGVHLRRAGYEMVARHIAGMVDRIGIPQNWWAWVGVGAAAAAAVGVVALLVTEARR